MRVDRIGSECRPLFNSTLQTDRLLASDFLFPLRFILVSLLHYFLLLLGCFFPHCQLVIIRNAQNPIFKLVYNDLALRASEQD